MWKKPWKFTEGFLIGGGLFVVGLVLHSVLGPVKWALLSSPVNWIILAILLVVMGIMYALRKKVYVFEWMMHSQAAVPSIVWALGLTIVMGLLPQSERAEAPWFARMLSFWPFVLVWAWMIVVAGMTTLNRLLHFKLKDIPFILNHLGVFVAVVAATLGSADVSMLEMTVYYDAPEWRAIDEDDESVVEPGLTIELHKFTVDYYDDMTPKRFASNISVYTEDGKVVHGTVEVNKPIKVAGWKIYQYDYDARRGSNSPYSVFLLVKDPWLPAVYTGIFMMLSGALCLMLFMAPKPSKKEDEQ